MAKRFKKLVIENGAGDSLKTAVKADNPKLKVTQVSIFLSPGAGFVQVRVKGKGGEIEHINLKKYRIEIHDLEGGQE